VHPILPNLETVFYQSLNDDGFLGQLHGGIISTLLDVPTEIPAHADDLAV
jgi:hypothetical protein